MYWLHRSHPGRHKSPARNNDKRVTPPPKNRSRLSPFTRNSCADIFPALYLGTLSDSSGEQGFHLRLRHPGEQSGGSHHRRSHAQTSRSAGRVWSARADVQAEPSLSLPLFFLPLSSGGSEAQRLLLDEQFHERDSQTECKSAKYAAFFLLLVTLFVCNFVPRLFSNPVQGRDLWLSEERQGAAPTSAYLDFYSLQTDYDNIMDSLFICTHLKCLFIFVPACGLCDPGRWRISSHVQSG